VHLLDGAAKPGAKILVSGGSRCNVTNTVVTERDYWGGKRTVIRRVLARLTVAQTVAFFEELGVSLKQEATGKLFPTTDRSRDVLNALFGAAQTLGVRIRPSTRVSAIRAEQDGFRVETVSGPILARLVVLAAGGLSLPKTGSDGAGLEMARTLGHSIVPTTPALAPMILAARAFHAQLSGVAQDVQLTMTVGDRVTGRIMGPMLWTHFGISGPAALDLSRHWLRAELEGRPMQVFASFAGGRSFDAVEQPWIERARSEPRATVHSLMADALPASVAVAIAQQARVDPQTRLSDLTREERRTLVHALTALPLPITGSRGYNYAEATAGGVSLDEIDPATMESRRCPGLFFVGEMLDVDGRLGGFNFQWAWSSGRTAGEAVARRALTSG
jgi:predicted Rossmann fold flavoprotein